MTTPESRTTVTERETELRTPHSAQDGSETGEARLRAGARESSALGVDEQPQTSHTESDGEASLLARIQALGERIWGAVEAAWPRIEALFRPPAVWTKPPASLSAVWRYADEGAWTTKKGFWRNANKVWCRLVAIPISSVAYYLAWFVQRPTRLFFGLVAYFVLTRVGLLSWLPWFW